MRNLCVIGKALVCLGMLWTPFAWAAPLGDRAWILAGRFAPPFGLQPGQKDLPVRAFGMDRELVTNEEFARFVLTHPRWSPERVSPLFADAGYLAHWTKRPGKLSEPPQLLLKVPVTSVSWFAARAYCEHRGGRLPTVLEWEYVAAADEKRPNASDDPAFVQKILSWYAQPFNLGELAHRKSEAPNFYGVEQLHDWVWEWTEDFAEPRGEVVACGGGVEGATRRQDYAAFMRYALRSSLEAHYSLPNQGFRCAYDKAPSNQERPL